MKKIIIFLVILMLVVGCKGKEDIGPPEIDALLFKEEYESLNNRETNYNNTNYRALNINENNPFIYKTANEILEMINSNETFVVYFGFPSCPWCRSIIPSLIDVSKDLNIDTIYYVDIKDIRDTLELDDNNNIVTTKEGTKDYYELLKKLDEVLDDYTLTTKDDKEIKTNEKRIYAPNIIAIIEGTATKITTGISNKQTDAFMELTEEIKKDSYNQIKCTIECVTEEKKVCTIDKKC